MNIVVDNDVLYKGACYGVLQEVVQAYTGTPATVGVLGAARFVVPKKIRKLALSRPLELVAQELSGFLSAAVQLEPTDAEQNFAADLESAAQQLGLNLDTGESQLCAIAIQRVVAILLTGDKRAIAAMERLLDTEVRLQALCGRVRCLEQAFLCVLDRTGLEVLRPAICAEPSVDKTLTICFGCHSATTQRETVLEGLSSYIRSLRADATRVLAS
ncbi:MAG: hypothetical protein LAO76_23020 [Acidobacteriia bacterium]|nr:hypothetical protein [Terriglobia bacterium]